MNYNFKINKDILPLRGKRIDWNKVNYIEVNCMELKRTYSFNIEDKKRNERKELYLLFSYKDYKASKYIRSNSITNGRLQMLFEDFKIIDKQKDDEAITYKKKCNVCGEIKSINDFEKNNSCTDGHVGTCKVCRLLRRKKYVKKCCTCQKEFITSRKEAKYCSIACKPQCQKQSITVKCSICGEEKIVNPYKVKTQKDFYCSDECKNKGYSLKYSGENSARYSSRKVNCNICGKEFTRNISEINKYKHNYCSKACASKGWTKYFSGENNPSYGKERLDMRGENNWNYNPNKTREQRQKDRKLLENTNWVNKVLKRDNYTCKCCGKKGGDLIAHHLDGYNWCVEKRYVIENGVTLCNKCHKNFHRLYGYGNNTIYQFDEFYKFNEKGELHKLNKKKSTIDNKSCKMVICITTNEIFKSMTEGAKHYNISISAISCNVRGKSKSAGVNKLTKEPLVWKYYNK